MKGDVFDKYYKRVARRGKVKSLFIGLTIGFFAMLVSAVLLFTLKADELFYISFIVFAVSTGVSVPLLYCLKYKPDRKEVARAVDELGMEERFMTMLELEGSRSYIAQKQRADTYFASQSVPAAAIKVMLSTALVVLLVVSGVLGLGATTYTALAYADVAPGFDDVVDALTPEEHYTYYEVSYEEYDETEDYDGYVVGDGIINGEIVQSVREGEDCTTVYAEAMDDSLFYCWSDGNTEPERTDLNIREDMTIYAVFLLADDESEGGEGDGSGEGENSDSDSDSSSMGEEGAESDDGSGDISGEGDGDEDGSGSNSSEDDSDGDPSTGIGSGNAMNNNVYDNATDYENEIASATEDVNYNIENGDYSDFEKMILGDYFGRLNP